jgi:hypothetical protein
LAGGTKERAGRDPSALARERRDATAAIQERYSVIIGKLQEMGWNAYLSSDRPEADIRAGPAKELRRYERYAVLPAVEDPRSPEQVFARLEDIAIELGRQLPKISLRGERHGWVGFVLEDERVKVSTSGGITVPLDEFIDALGTIMKV